MRGYHDDRHGPIAAACCKFKTGGLVESLPTRWHDVGREQAPLAHTRVLHALLCTLCLAAVHWGTGRALQGLHAALRSIPSCDPLTLRQPLDRSVDTHVRCGWLYTLGTTR